MAKKLKPVDADVLQAFAEAKAKTRAHGEPVRHAPRSESAILVPLAKAAPPEVRAEDPAAIARATARAVLDERQHDLDRMELVLEATTAVIAQSIEAKQTRNGRELTEFERDPEKFGRLVRALARGNYRETACRIAGIATSSVRNWMTAAETGDRRYQAVAHAIAVAEASAEDETIADVRAAGKDPRFWTAGMTWAERKFPDRWGRRQDDQTTPRVIVQIGVKDSDVQVNVGAALPTPSAAPSSLGRSSD
jgi:hypothetical protein